MILTTVSATEFSTLGIYFANLCSELRMASSDKSMFLRRACCAYNLLPNQTWKGYLLIDDELFQLWHQIIDQSPKWEYDKDDRETDQENASYGFVPSFFSVRVW